MRDPRDIRDLTDEQIAVLDAARVELLRDDGLESLWCNNKPNALATKAMIKDIFMEFGAVVRGKPYDDFLVSTASHDIHSKTFREWRDLQRLEKTTIQTLEERIKQMEGNRKYQTRWNVITLLVSILCAFGASWLQSNMSADAINMKPASSQSDSARANTSDTIQAAPHPTIAR